MIKMGWKGWGCRGLMKVICVKMEGFQSFVIGKIMIV